MTEYAGQEILLESGTNEMEILEFYLGDQSFGINVQKLQEIICYDPAKRTAMPESLPSMLGVYLVRGSSIPLVDLTSHLRRRPAAEPSAEARSIVLVCHFNGKATGFLVDGVNQIHRVNWQNVEPMAPLIERFRPRFTGTVHVEEREVLIVDLEHIMAEVDPEMGMVFDQEAEASLPAKGSMSRGDVGLLVAEDSVIIRLGIQNVLTSAGYGRVKAFADGMECFEELSRLKARSASEKEVLEEIQLLISDIEMPRMDGLTLCRRIREELGLKELKVVLFSSLISDQMAHKCKSVGADTWLSKPQIPALVKIVDDYCLAGAESVDK